VHAQAAPSPCQDSMQVKIIQSFAANGVAVPPGAVLNMPNDAAAEYIRNGLAVAIPSLPKREKAVRSRPEKAVTQTDA
jgi:hypothetical protein